MLDKDIMLGITAEARKKGKPRMRCIDMKSNWTLSKCLKTDSKKVAL